MNCTVFSKCNAPLCPEIESGDLFYPDEPICTAQSPAWVKAQRKIASKTRFREHYFTIEMLKQNCRIGRAIKGLDPEKEQEPQLSIWLKNHRPVKQISEEERLKKAENVKFARMAKQKKTEVFGVSENTPVT